MSINTRKISFLDKQNLNEVNENERYVLTAENVNEIKSVVNELSELLANRLVWSDFFKYIHFKIPSGLKSGEKDVIKYTLKIQLSDKQDFLTYNEINLSDDFEEPIVTIFKNDKWISVKNLIFTAEDALKDIQVDLQKYTNNIDFNEGYIPYFGRYKIIDLTNNKEFDWEGFSLSFSNIPINSLFDKDFKEIRIIGKNEIIGNSSEEYQVLAKLQDDSYINITDKCIFSLLNENGHTSLSGNIVSSINILESESQILFAECKYNDINYYTYFNIHIIPKTMVQLKIDGPSSINENSNQNYRVFALYSDGEEKNITNNCEIIINSINCRS